MDEDTTEALKGLTLMANAKETHPFDAARLENAIAVVERLTAENVALRADKDGRDVTDLPGLWSEDDTIWHSKPSVGPATQRVIDSVRTKITQEPMCPGVGYVFNFSIKVDDAKAFLAEQEANQ